MFNIVDLPAVRAQLAQDAAVAGQAEAEPTVSARQQGPEELEPAPVLSYPAKTLALVNGRYHAVEKKE